MTRNPMLIGTNAMLRALVGVGDTAHPDLHWRAALANATAVIALGVLAAAWFSPAYADSTEIFGPTEFGRETGPPTTATASFERCGTAGCEIVITNGAPDGANRVSSGSIRVNGEEVVGPRDFNPTVGEIVQPVELGNDNELTVRLTSKPGSFITVRIRCATSPAELSIAGRGADLRDSGTLSSALRIVNSGTADAENLQVTELTVTEGELISPASLPHALGTIPVNEGAVLDAVFGDSFVPRGSHEVAVEGTFEAAGATFCFALATDLEIPPAAPGSDILGEVLVSPLTVEGGLFPAHPPQFDEEVNRPIWTVPEGPLVPVTPTATGTGAAPVPEPALSPPEGPVALASDDSEVVFRANAGGINGGSEAGTSTTAEPSGASDGAGTVFVTGNWFAAFSTDGGSSFTPLDPTEVFPSDTIGFCCDQLVQYVPEIDRFIWLLQGSTNTPTRLGGYRLAAASPADLASSNATAWTYWNLTPNIFGQPSGTAFDYPDMSFGNDFLYLSWDAGWPNCPSGCDQGFQVARIPLDQIASAGTINIGFTDPDDGRMAWGAHVAQNPGDEVFWAGHNNNSEIRVFTLAEDSNTYFWRDVGIGSWARSGLSSTTPDGQDWMNKLSGFPSNAPHGLARNGNELWIAWSAGTDDNFPRPHIEMITLDRDDGFDVIRQVQIWNNDFAFGYPALATNVCTREIGLSLEYGGNDRYENHAVGFWGDFLVYRTTSSDVGTTRYGDYVGIRQQPPTEADPGNLFAAFGYGLNSTDNGTEVDVHYVSFGRPASQCPILE